MTDDPSGHRAPRKRRIVRVLLSTLVVLVLITGMGAAFEYRHLNHNVHHQEVGKYLPHRPKRVLPTGPDGPINILVMGYDGRDCEGCAIDGEHGAGGSDTTILLHISGDRSRVYGISIPRDSMVDRPACPRPGHKDAPAATHVMWNDAYAVGQEICTIAQFEALTDIRVDNYVTVNFASFKSMVDAIGGVEVCIPETIDDTRHNVHLAAGTRKIRGNEAETYIRARYGIGNGGDVGRTRRQQAFISSMISQAMSGSTLAHPWKLVRFLDAATKSLTTDFDGVKAMAGLALQLRHTGLDRIQFITVPTYEGTGADQYRLFWTDQAPEIWKRIKNDQRLGSDVTKDAIQANDVPTNAATPTAPAGTPSATGSPIRTEEQAKAYRQVGLCA